MIGTYPAFIHRVDEGDESAGKVALVQVHAWNVCHDECIVVSHQLQVIGCACSCANELVEGELCGFAAGPRHLDRAAPDYLRGRVGRVVNRVTEEIEPFLRVLLGVCAQRVVIDGGRGAGDLSVVRWRIEVDDIQGGFEEVDAGDEGLALDAVFVQVVWVAVGGCDEDDAVRHEGFEESIN